MSTTVQVTEEHIVRGTKRDLQSCPVALALRGLVGMHVFVHEQVIEVGDLEYGTSEALTAWIRCYDKGTRVTPITLVIGTDRISIQENA